MQTVKKHFLCRIVETRKPLKLKVNVGFGERYSPHLVFTNAFHCSEMNSVIYAQLLLHWFKKEGCRNSCLWQPGAHSRKLIGSFVTQCDYGIDSSSAPRWNVGGHQSNYQQN